jgi:hypothetical protein
VLFKWHRGFSPLLRTVIFGDGSPQGCPTVQSKYEVGVCAVGERLVAARHDASRIKSSAEAAH